MDVLSFLRTIRRKLSQFRSYQKLHSIKDRFLFQRWAKQTIKEDCGAILLGTPEHTNIGDSAIVLAEVAFLKKHLPERSRIAEMTVSDVKSYWDAVMHRIRANNKLVCHWHGGGNMGDQWLSEELFRRRTMQSIPQNPTIVFPQTIYYTDTETGKREKTESIQFYNDRSNLTLVAREKKSEFLMKELYPKTEVLLTPDIVLSTTMDQYGVKKQERNNVMFCVRADAEKRVDDSVWNILEKDFNDLGLDCFKTDMHSVKPVTKENRADRVREKMQEFCGARLVVTDRLHGMIFAALTGTPCIVFSNYNHKVKGTYDFISYLPYIKYAETVEQAESYIPDLLEMQNCEYDNEPLKPYFDELKKKILELTNNV